MHVVDATTQVQRATRRDWLGLAVLTLACLLYVMDLTVLHLAVPKLSAALRPSSAELLWIIDIYGFLVAGSLITMGTLGDRLGRRRLLLIGAAAFATTSLLAAFSTSAGMLIAARALMGIAGATLAPSTLSLIFSMFVDPRERSIAIGIWMSAFSAGSAIGPVLGGALLEYFWWGSVFLLALPVMVLLLVLGSRILPEYRDPQAGHLDLPSAGMSLAAVLALVFGLKLLAQDGFGPLAAGSVVFGLGLGALFVRRQLLLADPLIDPRLFGIPAFRASLATNVLTVFVAVGYFIFIPQYLQLVLRLSPLQAGLWSLPSAIGFVVGSNLAPRILRRFSPAAVVGACLSLAGVGLVLLTQLNRFDGLSVVVVASVVISLALAPVFSLTTELIVGSAPPERAGAASGISETCAELGGALGIAILGSVGAAVYRAQIAGGLPQDMSTVASDTARNTLAGAVTIAQELPGELGLALFAVARDAFVQGLQTAAAIGAGVAFVAAVLAVTLLRGVQAASHDGSRSDPTSVGGPRADERIERDLRGVDSEAA